MTVRVLPVLVAVAVLPGTALAASPSRSNVSTSSTGSVSWGTGASAPIMLRTGQSKTFTDAHLQTGDEVGCENALGLRVVRTVPRFAPGLPAWIQPGLASASKPGKGTVTIDVKRPSSRTVLVVCS